METYRRGGYDFMALMDHFMARYGFPIVDKRRIRTLLRAEVFAPATLLGEIWYIRAVGLIGRGRQARLVQPASLHITIMSSWLPTIDALPFGRTWCAQDRGN